MRCTWFQGTHWRRMPPRSSSARSRTWCRGATCCTTARWPPASNRVDLPGFGPHTWPAEDGSVSRRLLRRCGNGTGGSLLPARRGVEIVLWFETDLVCALALAQVADRLSGHLAPVWLVTVPNRADHNLRTAWRRRRCYQPRSEAFTALRSPDPRGWAAVPAFARLLAELPDVKTGLSALERAVLAALKLGALSAAELFTRVSAPVGSKSCSGSRQIWSVPWAIV
jgi:hypothetical protein